MGADYRHVMVEGLLSCHGVVVYHHATGIRKVRLLIDKKFEN